MSFETRTFDVSFSEADIFTCSMDEADEFPVDFGAAVQKEYRGVYRVTPSAEGQTLPTANKILSMDIVVDPIPSNYGEILWDGSALSVI